MNEKFLLTGLYPFDRSRLIKWSGIELESKRMAEGAIELATARIENIKHYATPVFRVRFNNALQYSNH